MAVELHPTYVVNDRGERVAVQLPVGEFHQLLEELEELESTIAFDAAMASGETPIPFDQVFAGIEAEVLQAHGRR